MRDSLRLYVSLIVLAVLSVTGCSAKVRVLNVSPAYESLDFYANAQEEDTLRISAVAHGQVSGYVALRADTYTLKFKRNGIDSTLYTSSGEVFKERAYHVFVAYGSSGHLAALELSEDLSKPASGQAKVQLLNTAEAGSLDVYLTQSSASLEDAAPLFDNIESGSAATESTLDSGNYRLRVTGADDTSDVRLDVPLVTLASEEVFSLIIAATDGGVLVDAILLPQQGNPVTYTNTKARVRGAVGVANGATVTARVGDVTLLNGAAAGVVGNYEHVDAGSASVSLSVNGVAVSVANQTLEAGAEYTLLVWSNTSGAQSTLIADDNHLPDGSGKAKVRVMNGLSALEVPVTMSIDYSPIAEGIALGQASAFTELDGGTDYRFDISNTNTAENLFSQSSISLQSTGVYTMFVCVNGGTVEGTLRRDR